jgi:KDO2-lipid IV(A) lauroyltransferase
MVCIGKKFYDERIDRLIVDIRSRNGVKYLHRKNSGKTILKYLKKGNIFGVLMDYNTDLEGVFVNYLGKLALSATAPLRIAMKYDIPIVVGSSIRREDDSHYFFYTLLDNFINTGNIKNDLVLNMEIINKHLSDAVLKYPDQWLWMIKKWNITPKTPGFENTPSILTIKK